MYVDRAYKNEQQLVGTLKSFVRSRLFAVVFSFFDWSKKSFCAHSDSLSLAAMHLVSDLYQKPFLFTALHNFSVNKIDFFFVHCSHCFYGSGQTTPDQNNLNKKKTPNQNMKSHIFFDFSAVFFRRVYVKCNNQNLYIWSEHFTKF